MRSDRLKSGDRVVLKPNIDCKKWRKGRIRYVGPVEGKKEDFYYGIALREANGKHNGTLNGKKYFDCPRNHGIFVSREAILDPSLESNPESIYNSKYSTLVSESKKNVWDKITSKREIGRNMSNHVAKVNLSFPGEGSSGLSFASPQKPVSIWSDRHNPFRDSFQGSELSWEKKIRMSPKETWTSLQSNSKGMLECSENSWTLDDKPKEFESKGLVNFGNTCYFNSVMQCMLQVGELKHVLLNSTWISDKHVFTLEFRAFFRKMYNVDNEYPLKPQNLFRAFCLFPDCGDYAGLRQQDVGEFVELLLDGMSDECKGESKFIEHLFQGKLQSIVECLECGNVSPSEEAFWTLPVDMGRQSGGVGFLSRLGFGDKSYDLEDLLISLSNVEHLVGDNLYECDKCLAKVPATKQLKVLSKPKTLVIHIKRFYHVGNIGKLDNFVSFRREISLGNEGVTKSCSSKYNIKAIVVHRGASVSSGHYVAYVCIKSDRWLEFDDEMVKRVDWEFVQRQRAYLLFYDKVSSTH